MRGECRSVWVWVGIVRFCDCYDLKSSGRPAQSVGSAMSKSFGPLAWCLHRCFCHGYWRWGRRSILVWALVEVLRRPIVMMMRWLRLVQGLSVLVCWALLNHVLGDSCGPRNRLRSRLKLTTKFRTKYLLLFIYILIHFIKL